MAEDPREPEGSEPEHDIDAEFAAMMEGLSLPEEMRADLEALERAGAGAEGAEQGAPEGSDEDSDEDGQWDGPQDGSEETAGEGVARPTAADVPHNTYGAPSGTPGDGPDPDGLTPEQVAEVEALAAALAADVPTADAEHPRAVKVAVVLTPLASADALAALCSMSELDCTAVPATSGAVAVKEFVSAHAEWDVSELLGGAETEPAEAAELAGALSRLSRGGVVMLTADLATDVGIESGLSGTITARRYENGQAGEEVSSGLILASMDPVVEDILLGIQRAEDVRGAVRSSEVRPGRAMRWFGRGLRRPRGDHG